MNLQVGNLQVGDIVKVMQLTADEKSTYPGGWSESMNEYVGMTTKIERIYEYQGRMVYRLACDDQQWAWSDKNLSSIHKKMSLF